MAENITAQSQVHFIQLAATSDDTDATIRAEIAAYELARSDTLKPSPGSTAVTPDLAVICRKQNDGNWLILR